MRKYARERASLHKRLYDCVHMNRMSICLYLHGVHMSGRIHTRGCVHACVCVSTLVCAHMYAYVHACICERECDCVHVWVRLVCNHALQIKNRYC